MHRPIAWLHYISYCIETSERKSIPLSQNKYRYSDRFKSRRVDRKTLCTDRKCHRKLVFKTRPMHAHSELQKPFFSIAVSISKEAIILYKEYSCKDKTSGIPLLTQVSTTRLRKIEWLITIHVIFNKN